MRGSYAAPQAKPAGILSVLLQNRWTIRPEHTEILAEFHRVCDAKTIEAPGLTILLFAHWTNRSSENLEFLSPALAFDRSAHGTRAGIDPVTGVDTY